MGLTVAANSYLLVDEVNLWLVPLAALKTVDQSSSAIIGTTNQNDLALYLDLGVNATYKFECFLNYEGGATGVSDLQWQWATFPGTVMRYQATLTEVGAPVTAVLQLDNSTVTPAGTNGTGNLRTIFMDGTVTTPTIANALLVKQFPWTNPTFRMTLQWSQVTASATPTIVHANSLLRARRLS